VKKHVESLKVIYNLSNDKWDFLGTDYAVALCNHISKTVKSV
jgi:hypothetical protein